MKKSLVVLFVSLAMVFSGLSFNAFAKDSSTKAKNDLTEDQKADKKAKKDKKADKKDKKENKADKKEDKDAE